ncbi:hypothetical protein [Aliikangiella maris]|uniref:Uncharacterized protein n=1 Tax=Aliikangiella maris TaxID=3162458 RepID=A0ABV2C0I2_9GAMM
MATLSSFSIAESGEKVKQIFYCGEDFAIKMDSGNWYLVDKSQVGELKFNHFLTIAMTLLASGKKTGNVFPGDPIPSWCGNSNFRPITILSITDES